MTDDELRLIPDHPPIYETNPSNARGPVRAQAPKSSGRTLRAVEPAQPASISIEHFACWQRSADDWGVSIDGLKLTIGGRVTPAQLTGALASAMSRAIREALGREDGAVGAL